jgi:hypothetical protein
MAAAISSSIKQQSAVAVAAVNSGSSQGHLRWCLGSVEVEMRVKSAGEHRERIKLYTVQEKPPTSAAKSVLHPATQNMTRAGVEAAVSLTLLSPVTHAFTHGHNPTVNLSANMPPPKPVVEVQCGGLSLQKQMPPKLSLFTYPCCHTSVTFPPPELCANTPHPRPTWERYSG